MEGPVRGLRPEIAPCDAIQGEEAEVNSKG
jgi:hypothetical protein